MPRHAFDKLYGVSAGHQQQKPAQCVVYAVQGADGSRGVHTRQHHRHVSGVFVSSGNCVFELWTDLVAAFVLGSGLHPLNQWRNQMQNQN